jgi:biotin-dependent carboxylase-like uncharacterized protein
MTFEVVEAGLLTTIQDAGRPDWTHLGVPVGGACDGWSLEVANLLAGNDPGSAAVEMTVVGATFAVRAATTVALAGADLGGIVRETDRPLLPGRTHRLDAGTTIAFGGGGPGTGAREYLALPGGVDVPVVLGSSSTALGAGFGGIEGRRLEPSDVVRARNGLAARAAAWAAMPDDPLAESADGMPIRVLPGPAPGLGPLVDADWRVGAGSDRIGLRLEGRRVDAAPEILSHGVVFGAIQIPPGGAPIVMLADHQTTGGYPIAAVVIRADLPRIGQLRPGAPVRFVEVSMAAARAALISRREAMARGAAALREGAGWDELWQSAGG